MDSKVEEEIDRIREGCELLVSGYHEKVEYSVEVAYHRGPCSHYGKSTLPKNDCECPVVNEKRVRNVKRPGLLTQLKDFAQNKDTDRNPKAERGAPRVKVAGRPPGDMGGFFALDEIECDVLSAVDRWLDENKLDRTWAAERETRAILNGLHRLVGEEAARRPAAEQEATVRPISTAVARWVASARRTLMINASDSIFDGVVCGNCGGGLSTPWGNRGEADVRCVGSPTEPPCGHSYPMSEWINLYAEGRR